MVMMNTMEQQSKQFSEKLTAINNSQQEMTRQFGQFIQMVMQPYYVQTFGGMQHQLNSSSLGPSHCVIHTAQYLLLQVKVLYRQKLQPTLLLLLYIRAYRVQMVC